MTCFRCKHFSSCDFFDTYNNPFELWYDCDGYVVVFPGEEVEEW